MLKSRLFAALTAIALALPGFAAHASDVKLNTTADHSKFKELQREFTSGPEVTKACLTCHTEAAKQIHRTKHWTWEVINPENQQRLGKKHVINNFCISTQRTSRLHHLPRRLRHGRSNFDFKSQENVDCLVCHDTTGNYKKLPGLAATRRSRMRKPPGRARSSRRWTSPRWRRRSARPAATPAAPATSSAAAAMASSTATWIARWLRPTRSSTSTWMPPDSTSPAAPATRPRATMCRAAATRRAARMPATPTSRQGRQVQPERPARPATAKPRTRPERPTPS